MGFIHFRVRPIFIYMANKKRRTYVPRNFSLPLDIISDVAPYLYKRVTV